MAECQDMWIYGYYVYTHGRHRIIFEDNEGYAVSKNGQRVIAFDGKEFKVNDFAGVVKGKNGNVIFLKSDIGSLIEAKEMGLI